MALKFYNTEKAAEMLGVSPAEVNQMREGGKLHGYRDGSDWKFKVEDVEKLASQRGPAPASDQPADAAAGETGGGDTGQGEGDVLLSEVELGQAESGASGTVIGSPDSQTSEAESDIQLAGSDVNLAEGSDGGDGGEQAGSKGSEFEELDLTLDEDLTLEDSQARSARSETSEEPGGDIADSSIDLSAKGEGLEDDDLVLGGSGSGSDITIGGDSGISLVDPTDSGLSLEEPLELVGMGDESLELGEDDMISFSEDADTESPTELKSDGDFLLTPMDDGAGDEDSASGSQVIALDSEPASDDAATMIGGGSAPGMPAMLDEDVSGQPADLGMAAGAPMGPAAGAQPGPMGAPQGAPGGAPQPAYAGAALPEAPYTVWNVLSLAACAIILVLTGMMAYDLLRNMWSWEGPYTVNSSLMDGILSMFEG
jgi:excisionase family DNA binding protein